MPPTWLIYVYLYMAWLIYTQSHVKCLWSTLCFFALSRAPATLSARHDSFIYVTEDVVLWSYVTWLNYLHCIRMWHYSTICTRMWHAYKADSDVHTQPRACHVIVATWLVHRCHRGRGAVIICDMTHLYENMRDMAPLYVITRDMTHFYVMICDVTLLYVFICDMITHSLVTWTLSHACYAYVFICNYMWHDSLIHNHM